MNGKQNSQNKTPKFIKPKALCYLASIVTLFFVVVLYALSFYSPPVDPSFLPSHVKLLAMESTRTQYVFYMLLIVMLAIFSVILLIYPQIKSGLKIPFSLSLLITMLTIYSFVLGSWRDDFLNGFLFVLLIFHYCPKIPISLKLFFRSGIVLLVSYLMVFYVMPFSAPYVVSDANLLVALEGHYTVTLLPGFDLVCCQKTGTIERASYGFGIPILTGLALKLMALLGHSDYLLVQVVKLYQLLAVLIITAICYITNRKSWPFSTFLALLINAYTLTNISHAIGFPNQTGIRYIVFLATLLLLAFEIQRNQIRTWLLAGVAAIAVVLSPETGLASSAGYMVAVTLNAYRGFTPIFNSIRATLIFLMVFFTTLAIGFALVVGTLSSLSISEFFGFTQSFSKGYGGLSEKPNITATWLFFFASFAVLRGVNKASNNQLRWIDLYQAALGTMILIWMFYYINRMHEWNLWFHLVLLVLMIAPRLNLASIKLLFIKQLSLNLTPYPLLLAAFMGGQLVQSNSQFYDQIEKWSLADFSKCANISGFCLEEPLAGRLDQKMQAMTRYPITDTLVLSTYNLQLRLRGYNEGFPGYDPFGECLRQLEVDNFVEWLKTKGPKYILIDDPSDKIVLAIPERNAFYDEVYQRSRAYKKVGEDSGWIVLQRITTYSPNL